MYLTINCCLTVIGPRVVVSTAAFHARVRGSVPGLGGFKETKNVSSPFMCESQFCGEPPWPRGSVLGLRPPGSNFESCVWRTVSSQSSHHPQEVLLAQFSLYVHKCGLKPDSFHFISFDSNLLWILTIWWSIVGHRKMLDNCTKLWLFWWSWADT